MVVSSWELWNTKSAPKTTTTAADLRTQHERERDEYEDWGERECGAIHVRPPESERSERGDRDDHDARETQCEVKMRSA